jgi:hypothetical protein
MTNAAVMSKPPDRFDIAEQWSKALLMVAILAFFGVLFLWPQF